jgi:hypothetical protein
MGDDVYRRQYGGIYRPGKSKYFDVALVTLAKKRQGCDFIS